MLDIIEKYSEPYRHYHNLEHIFKMLQNMSVFCLTDSEKIILRLAILYHDYIYIPGEKSNEVKSANVFLMKLMENKIEFNERIVDRVKVAGAVNVMILDTEKHIPTFYLSNFLNDLDLWELHNETAYFDNKYLIRKEFEMFSEEEFREGRIKWVNSMLSKDKIFYTGYCINNNFESSARRILLKDLKILESFQQNN